MQKYGLDDEVPITVRDPVVGLYLQSWWILKKHLRYLGFSYGPFAEDSVL